MMPAWIRVSFALLVLGGSIATKKLAAQEIPVPIPLAASKYIGAIEAHMDYLTEQSLDTLGEHSTAMWLATIDIRTNTIPQSPLPAKVRWGVGATSPGGANLYWDQPTILASYELARRTGCACYEDAADAYLRDFLSKCVDPQDGSLSWGHNRYYDVVQDKPVRLGSGTDLCFPHTPAWELLWAIDRKVTERAIMAMAEATEKATNATDQGSRPTTLLAAQAVLIDSISWLAATAGDPDGSLRRLAIRVAKSSVRNRDANTGLLPTPSPNSKSESPVSTVEIGVWAGALLRAADHTSSDELRKMATSSVDAWLRFAFDVDAQKYRACVVVSDGRPATERGAGAKSSSYADPFDSIHHPDGHSPIPLAEACLTLYEQTGEEPYRLATERWVEQIRSSLAESSDRGAYADDYGRVIHFLTRAGMSLDRTDYRELAERVADEAMRHLYVPKMGMFRSHPGEDRCDAVDGPGLLILSLMNLEGALPESAFHF